MMLIEHVFVPRDILLLLKDHALPYKVVDRADKGLEVLWRVVEHVRHCRPRVLGKIWSSPANREPMEFNSSKYIAQGRPL